MKLSFTAFSLAIAASTVAAGPICNANYFQTFEIDADDCNSKDIHNRLREEYNKADAELEDGCPNSFKHDYRRIFSAVLNPGGKILSKGDVNRLLNQKCKDALQAATAASFSTAEGSYDDLDALGMPASFDLEEFFNGEGFLNTETGNFQQDNLNPDKFLYTGTDPTQNDHYPTSPESYAGGQAVDAFEDSTNKKEYLADPLGYDGTCQHNAMMCCWHRDRQYGDGNGNCKSTACVNKDPGDNTNLCWTEDDAGTPSPYPGKAPEGSLHCHGLAWSDDMDTVNDYARFNNLFYISLYDHMYQRGYVESITHNDLIANTQPMCGCIEDMNPVSRADCQEATPTTRYTMDLQQSSFSLTPIAGTFEMEFNACNGYEFNANINATDILDPDVDIEALVDDGTLTEKANDLSAFVYRLHLEDRMEEDTMYAIYDTLVGYDNPNDNANEAACKRAYEEKFPGRQYPSEDEAVARA